MLLMTCYAYYNSAGGCPLAETLAQGGLNVLLVERGAETLPPETANIKTSFDAVST
jgi:choline dehydrogenase-like flavoprotein